MIATDRVERLMRQWRAHAAVLRGSSRGGNAAHEPRCEPVARKPITDPISEGSP
jgi:hypothetical protein